jgi:hypothetical protein
MGAERMGEVRGSNENWPMNVREDGIFAASARADAPTSPDLSAPNAGGEGM